MTSEISTTRVPVRELIGTTLNWAVARRLKKRPSLHVFHVTGALAKEHSYSTDWSIGGSLLEAELLSIEPTTLGGDRAWRAVYDWTDEVFEAEFAEQFGPTMLIAGMRALVGMEAGEFVEIPSCLLPA